MVIESLLLDKNVFVYHSIWMTFFWLLHMPMKNGGMVDFGWPSGFTLMSIYYFVTGTGNFWRRAIITAAYVFCGVRFMVGWVGRHGSGREDKRWNLWRERWRNGEGWFGIRIPAINFFCFYHAQSFANIFVFSAPLALVAHNPNPLGWTEVAAIAMWFGSFFMENVADLQLAAFKSKKENREKTMRSGLWAYSRHPNYFFEFMIHMSYTLYALSSVATTMQLVQLLVLPALAYYFLVHFTGVWITEQSSLRRRGEEFKRYQDSVSMFFPWFPKHSKSQ